METTNHCHWRGKNKKLISRVLMNIIVAILGGILGWAAVLGDFGIYIILVFPVYLVLSQLAVYLKKKWLHVLNTAIVVAGTILLVAFNLPFKLSEFSASPEISKPTTPLSLDVLKQQRVDEWKRQKINVLISEFDNGSLEIGRKYTATLIESLKVANRRIRENFDGIDSTVDFQMINKVMHDEELYKQGKHENAELVVRGVLTDTIRDNDTLRVARMKCIALDSSLIEIFSHEKRTGPDKKFTDSISFAVTTFDSASDYPSYPLSALVNSILYASRSSVNLKMMKIAYNIPDGNLGGQILGKVKTDFSVLDSLLQDPAVSAFHRANSYAHCARYSDILYRESLYRNEEANFEASLDKYKIVPPNRIFNFNPATPFEKLTDVYQKLYDLTTEPVWLEKKRLLDMSGADSSDSESKLRYLLSRFDRWYNSFQDKMEMLRDPEFIKNIKKYRIANQILIEIIDSSDKPLKQKNEEVGKLEPVETELQTLLQKSGKDL